MPGKAIVLTALTLCECGLPCTRLWLEQVVALAQAQGFLGGPVEEPEETPANSESEQLNNTAPSADEAAESTGKPTQAVAPVKATQAVTPISPAYVTAEIAKSATSVQSTKVITPRAAASMLLSSSPALKRAVSSLVASPGNSPLLRYCDLHFVTCLS